MTETAGTQYVLIANTKPDLDELLTAHGLRVETGGGNQAPAPGVTYSYGGPWVSGGVDTGKVYGLFAWITPPADAGEAQARDDIINALRTDRALYDGNEPPGMLAGTSGYKRPTGADWIKRERSARQLRGGFPVTDPGGATVWWHSDFQSRSQQMGLMLAAVYGILQSVVPAQQWATVLASPMANPRTGKQQTWRMMSGETAPLTIGKMFTLLQAALAQEGAIDEVARAALAAEAAGTLTDMSAIPWPKGYGE